MNSLTFSMGGMLGDAIHTLAVVKHLTDKDGPGSCVLLGAGGDTWKYGSAQAHKDLKSLVGSQDYINGFYHTTGQPVPSGDIINLNTWREVVATTHAETGKYNTCWSELLAQVYGYEIKYSKWFDVYAADDYTKDRIVIHRSKHRHNGSFRWLDFLTEEAVFVTNDQMEWDLFPYKDKAQLHLVKSVAEMAVAINSGKLFIGNQSAPLAIASALDVPRLCELDADPAPFYMGEEQYSNNIKWFLNDQVNNL